MNGKIERLSKETEDRMEKNRNFGTKNTVSEIKLSLDGFNSQMSMTKVRVSELAERAIDIIQCKLQREDWGEK